jgi:hypothetical protein
MNSQCNCALLAFGYAPPLTAREKERQKAQTMSGGCNREYIIEYKTPHR